MVIVCFRQLHFWHRPVWPEESLEFTWNSDPGGQLTNISTRRQDWAAEIDLFHLRSPIFSYLLWYRKHIPRYYHIKYLYPQGKILNNKFAIYQIISTFLAPKKLPKEDVFYVCIRHQNVLLVSFLVPFFLLTSAAQLCVEEYFGIWSSCWAWTSVVTTS